MTNRPSTTALIVVDVQRAFDEWEAAGKRRNNPDAVARIADLLEAARADLPYSPRRHPPELVVPARRHRFRREG
jgi:hypothetical protein